MKFYSNIKIKFSLLPIILLILSILLNISTIIKADLPVHCLKHDIIGEWVIKASIPKEVNSGHDMKCGHSEPSSENNAYLAQSPYPLDLEYHVVLKNVSTAVLTMPNTPNNKQQIGNWTMVYDEGFNIDTEDWSFFAFSKYEVVETPDANNYPSKKIFNSKCYATCVGWYTNKKMNKWGCYQAYKKGVNPNQVISSNTKNDMQIVEPKNLIDNSVVGAVGIGMAAGTGNNESNNKTNNNTSNNELTTVQNNLNSLNSNTSNFSDTEKKNIEEYKNQFQDIKKKIEIIHKLEEEKNISEDQKIKSNLKRMVDKHINTNTSKFTSFLSLDIRERMTNQLKLDAAFSNHFLYLHRLNSVKKSWQAEVTPKFMHMSIKDLNRFAGIPRMFNRIRFRQREKDDLKMRKVRIQEDVSMYPNEFNWKEKLRPAGSQGNCGSCYAYSSTRMAEARLQITYDHKQVLSVQHNIDCSFYNQGCSGGYPFLMMKFAHQFDMIPDFCKPYMEMNSSCSDECNKSKLPYVYRLNNYKYLGGSYGQCSEKAIMEEVFKYGPIVVSFEPDYNLMLYKSGVYHSLEEDSWINTNVTKPEWQKVDHSVLLVGWGIDKNTGEKYWIIQNTWGPNWGEEGFFKMRRGVDELGIESICEAAHPVIVDNKSRKQLSPEEYKKMSMNEVGDLRSNSSNISSNNSNSSSNSNSSNAAEQDDSIFEFITSK